MGRKKWSDEARKKQSKIIKKMWADKKKASVTMTPVIVEERDLNTVSATWVEHHLEECLKECKTKAEMTKYLKDMMETVDRIKSEDRREAHRRHKETAIHDNVTDAEILIIGDGYNINGIQEPQRIMGSIPFWVPYDVSMMDHLPEDPKALEWFVNLFAENTKQADAFSREAVDKAVTINAAWRRIQRG